jgi:tRNA-splicing ligase RtcB
MGRRRKLEAAVRRVDATRIRIENPQGVPITLFANSGIPVDAGAVEQLLELVSLQETLDSLAGRGFWDGAAGRVDSIVVTPDFHRGVRHPDRHRP